MDFDARYEEAKTYPQMFIGKDGKLYVKNPWDNGPYSYARYPDKKAYDNGRELPLEHVNHETAIAQFTQEEVFKFVIAYNDKEETVITNLAGDLEDPIDDGPVTWTILEDYLKALYKRYGRDNVKFTYNKETRSNVSQ